MVLANPLCRKPGCTVFDRVAQGTEGIGGRQIPLRRILVGASLKSRRLPSATVEVESRG